MPPLSHQPYHRLGGNLPDDFTYSRARPHSMASLELGEDVISSLPRSTIDTLRDARRVRVTLDAVCERVDTSISFDGMREVTVSLSVFDASFAPVDADQSMREYYDPEEVAARLLYISTDGTLSAREKTQAAYRLMVGVPAPAIEPAKPDPTIVRKSRRRKLD